MEIQYKLEGAGWATVRLRSTDEWVELDASYLRDSLRQLAQACIAIRSGKFSAQVVFTDEPGEHHLLLKRRRRHRVGFELREYSHWISEGFGDASDFETLLVGETTREELTAAVRGTLEGILDTWGINGYREQWIEHEFPAAELEELRAG